MGVKEVEWRENADFLKKAMVGFAVVFLITYGVALAEQNMPSNDYSTHADWASMIEWGRLGEYFRNTIAYPLWHFGVKFCESVLAVNLCTAAALVTALFNGFAYVSVLGIWKATHAHKLQKDKIVFWAVSLFLINPLYAPWFNSNYYLGQTAPNVWHNPTNIAVKGFAVASFGLVVWLLHKKEEKNRKLLPYLLLSAALVLSALAKPSFLQGFIPGLGIFIVLRLFLERKRFPFKFYVKLCVACVPAVAVLLLQSFATFFNTDYIRPESKIRIGWGTVLYQWTPSLFVSFLLSFAFPLFVFVLNFKKLVRKEEIQVMLCYEAAAWLEAVLLYEEGSAFGQANFTWAGLLSAFIVWCVMLYYFIVELYDSEGYGTIRKKVTVYGGILLFAGHLLFGVIYWYRLFSQVARY